MTDKIFLRKRDLVEAMGMARGTVSDWITDYQMFMPTERHGNVTYFRPEAIEVLRAIRELKEEGYAYKPEVVQKLTERGFPITIEEDIAEIEESMPSVSGTRDAMIKVVTELSRQSQALDQVKDQLSGYNEAHLRHQERLDDIDGRIGETEGQYLSLHKTIEELRGELEKTRAEAAAARLEAENARTEASKSFWQKIFGGKR